MGRFVNLVFVIFSIYFVQ